ncbi:hypothetical protein NQ315_001171 [Exocentrus adspersus]|uniref:Uncharacterized protein n=1 Tax=Exocentrus adspersus TaxID=1586481 RepID=A0AAV8WEX3_9CUCU|nr:hypothetical protein NQ315_001171 [Exocentrus adspersus]
MSISVTVITLALLVAAVSCNQGEYYWRPWTPGSPPSDAVTVRDYRGASYIVEAYVPDPGSRSTRGPSLR